MDWLLDPRRGSVLERAADAVGDHLRRHAAQEEAVDAAVDQVRETLEKTRPDHDCLLWLHLNWLALHPRLSVHHVDPRRVGPVSDEVADDAHAGLCPVRPQRRHELAGAALPPAVTLELAVVRSPAVDVDPEMGVLADLDVDPLRDGAAAAAVALSAAAEAHPAGSADQVAAIAGSLLADSMLRQEAPRTAHEAMDLFIRAQAAMGAVPDPVTVEDDRFELTIDRCPFGQRAHQSRSLTRLTQALAGRIAARVTGVATVVVDESVAFGDPVCRLQVVLNDSEPGVVGASYRWPPVGTPVVDRHSSAPRLEVAVSLPRESHSVPVVRRLAAQALRAFGVVDDDVADVELAITEACANVVEHAVDSDSYEVNIELAADRCAITVLDRGAGFDASSVTEPDDPDAEGGRGLTLMRALVENVYFSNEPMVGAVVHMVKPLHYDTGHPWHQALLA